MIYEFISIENYRYIEHFWNHGSMVIPGFDNTYLLLRWNSFVATISRIFLVASLPVSLSLSLNSYPTRCVGSSIFSVLRNLAIEVRVVVVVV